jgi:hypothetical protein
MMGKFSPETPNNLMVVKTHGFPVDFPKKTNPLTGLGAMPLPWWDDHPSSHKVPQLAWCGAWAPPWVWHWDAAIFLENKPIELLQGYAVCMILRQNHISSGFLGQG